MAITRSLVRAVIAVVGATMLVAVSSPTAMAATPRNGVYSGHSPLADQANTVVAPDLKWKRIDDGKWESPEHWKCSVLWGGSASGVQYKGCVPTNDNRGAQAVIVMRNNTGHRHNIRADSMDLHVNGHAHYERSCAPSPLNTNHTVACFGPTVTLPRGTKVQEIGYVEADGEGHKANSRVAIIR